MRQLRSVFDEGPLRLHDAKFLATFLDVYAYGVHGTVEDDFVEFSDMGPMHLSRFLIGLSFPEDARMVIEQRIHGEHICTLNRKELRERGFSTRAAKTMVFLLHDD